MDVLALIFLFVIVAGSIALWAGHQFHRRAVNHEERKLELIARAEEARKGGNTEAFRKLEERVRVLERIATDSKQDLAMQIEQLRDLHELDALEARQETTR